MTSLGVVKDRAHSLPASRCRRGPGERPLRPAAPAGLYQGGPVGAHMHDPSATRPDKVGIMIGTWLAALLKTPPHRRLVRLDRATRTVEIVDEIDGGSHDLRLAFHLGPDVRTELTGSAAFLCWRGASAPGRARLALPRQLRWSLHRGETDPILGWYSCGLGRLTPTCTLIGRGRSAPHAAFVTRLHFPDRWPEQARLAESSGTQIPAVSRTNT